MADTSYSTFHLYQFYTKTVFAEHYLYTWNSSIFVAKYAIFYLHSIPYTFRLFYNSYNLILILVIYIFYLNTEFHQNICTELVYIQMIRNTQFLRISCLSQLMNVAQFTICVEKFLLHDPRFTQVKFSQNQSVFAPRTH